MKTCPLCETSYPSQHTTCPTDGALLIESRTLDPGTVIRGKYRILRQLGRGGMGTVYLAEHILLGRQRALKFIAAELAQDPTFLRRFRREAQAAIELRHPNIVEVVDLDQAEDGSPYIAMEYVQGPDLRQALSHASRYADSDHGSYQGTTSQTADQQSFVTGHDFSRAENAPNSAGVLTPEGCFPVPRALAIARGIAQGLGAAHAKGIVHRDVKPENILIAATGAEQTPKLLDFGIAAIKETAITISRTHGLTLTPQYAAPEQWKGMTAEDLYAPGRPLRDANRPPLQAQNTEGWMYRHLHQQPQTASRNSAMRSHRDELPTRCCEKHFSSSSARSSSVTRWFTRPWRRRGIAPPLTMSQKSAQKAPLHS